MKKSERYQAALHKRDSRIAARLAHLELCKMAIKLSSDETFRCTLDEIDGVRQELRQELESADRLDDEALEASEAILRLLTSRALGDGTRSES